MKVAVVTGASSGIGRSTAVEIARRGSGTVLTWSSNEQGAKETVREIEQLGGTAVALPLDIAGTAASRPSARPWPVHCAGRSGGTRSTSWSTTRGSPGRR